MANNSTMGGTTDQIRDLDRAGVKTQIVGLDLGIGTGTESLMSGTMPVSGAVSRNAATTYAVTTVNTSGTASTNTVLLAADTTRKALLIWNRGTVPLTIGFGTATSSTVWSVIIPANAGYECPPELAPSAVNGQSTVVTSPVNFTAAT